MRSSGDGKMPSQEQHPSTATVADAAPSSEFDVNVYFLFKAGIIVGSGGLIFGYDIGVIAGTLSQLNEEFHFSYYEAGLVVAIIYAGSIFGSVIGGPLCDWLGRWRTIHIQNFIFIVGAVWTAGSTSTTHVCIGRFIVGVASAVSGIADVPYLTEISPPEYRGLLASQYEMAIGIGVLLSFCADLFFEQQANGWRWAFIVPAVMALIQSCGMFLLPDSPKWLIERHHYAEARCALKAIYGSQVVQMFLADLPDDPFVAVHNYQQNHVGASERTIEMAALPATDDNSREHSFHATQSQMPADFLHFRKGYKNYVQKLEHQESGTTIGQQQVLNPLVAHAAELPCPEGMIGHQTHSDHVGIATQSVDSEKQDWELLEEAELAVERDMIVRYTYPIVLVAIVQIMAQITGGNVVRNFAPIIFENGGVAERTSLVYNVLLGVVKAVFTIASIFFIETSGRVALLYAGVLVLSAGMAFLMVSSLLFSDQDGNLSSPELFVVGCGMVYAGFGLGYGPIPWVLSSEMFPTAIRGRVMSVSLVASNIAQLVANFMFLPMVQSMHNAGAFGVFLVLNLLTLCFVKAFIVETRSLEPSSILQQLLQKYDDSVHITVCGRKVRWLGWLCCECCDHEEYDSIMQQLSQHSNVDSRSSGQEHQ